MQIFHISDTHGSGFWDSPIPAGVDVVVHTGDAFPNYTRGNVAVEARFQSEWLSRFADPIRSWLGDKPFVYVPGNHDYIEFQDFIPAIRASSTPSVIGGRTWLGFREIPWIAGEWAGELRSPEMAAVVNRIFSVPVPADSILLCHVPPAGIFDTVGRSIHGYGCGHLATALQYRSHSFRAVLFGHVHQERYCQEQIGGIIFSNAADNPGGIVRLD